MWPTDTAAQFQESLSTGKSVLIHQVLRAHSPDACLEHSTSQTCIPNNAMHYAVRSKEFHTCFVDEHLLFALIKLSRCEKTNSDLVSTGLI